MLQFFSLAHHLNYYNYYKPLYVHVLYIEQWFEDSQPAQQDTTTHRLGKGHGLVLMVRSVCKVMSSVCNVMSPVCKVMSSVYKVMSSVWWQCRMTYFLIEHGD
eukprot:scpid109333/ scgid6707/ 